MIKRNHALKDGRNNDIIGRALLEVLCCLPEVPFELCEQVILTLACTTMPAQGRGRREKNGWQSVKKLAGR